MSQHILSVRTNFVIFAALMALLGATVGAAYIDLGRWNLPVAMAIATAKAVLILLYFMHVRFSHRLTWVFSGAAFLWLAIMLVLSLSDYTTRDWLAIEGK